MAEVNSPEIGKKHKHYQKRTRIKSIVTPRRMKRGKSEEPFLDHDGNIAYSSDSEDNKLVEKDVVDAAAKAQDVVSHNTNVAMWTQTFTDMTTQMNTLNTNIED